MAAIWRCAVAQMRGNKRSVLALILLAGIAGAVVMGAVAGARRTDSAYRRALRAHDSPDIFVIPEPGQSLDLARVESLPEVRRSARFAFMPMGRRTGEGPMFDIYPFAAVDGAIDMGSLVVIEGRNVDDSRPDEATVNVSAAERFGIKVGEVLPMVYATPEEARVFVETGSPPEGFTGTPVDVKIVGIASTIDEVASPPTGSSESLNLSAAFYKQHVGSELFQASAIDLHRDDGDVPTFRTAVERLSDRPVPMFVQAETTEQIQRTIDPHATALTLFALFAGIVAALVLGQALARHAGSRAAEQDIVRALGLTRQQRRLVSVVAAVPIGIGAAVIAVGGAVALSPIMPVGIARKVEPSPGVSVDAAVLAAGAICIVALICARASLVSFGRRHVARDPSGAGSLLARAGAPAHMSAGVSLAFGRTAPASRGALVGIAFGVAGFVIAATFAVSLDRVEREPSLTGSAWDLEVNGAYGPDIRDRVEPILFRAPEVASFSSVAIGEATIAGVGTGAFGIDPVKGPVLPPMLEGMAPRAPNEVALGVRAMRRARAKVGERVRISVGDRAHTFDVVGRAVVPSLGLATQRAFGDGAIFTVEGLKTLTPGVAVNVFFVRANGSVAEAKERLERNLELGPDTVTAPGLPAEISNLEPVNAVPYLLAGLLGLLSLAALAHATTTYIRDSRRELAILKTFGSTRAQLAGMVGSVATLFAIIAVVVGVPVGIAAGRWAWSVFAGRMGIVAQPVLHWWAASLAFPLAIVGAWVAAWPGTRAAASVKPAVSLRAE